MSTFVSPMTTEEEYYYAKINQLHIKFMKYRDSYELKIKKTRSYKDFQKYGRFYIFNCNYNSVIKTHLEDLGVIYQNMLDNYNCGK